MIGANLENADESGLTLSSSGKQTLRGIRVVIYGVPRPEHTHVVGGGNLRTLQRRADDSLNTQENLRARTDSRLYYMY